MSLYTCNSRMYETDGKFSKSDLSKQDYYVILISIIIMTIRKSSHNLKLHILIFSNNAP